MKKNILLALAFVAILFTTKAQTVQDIFDKNYTPITWLGIDFSHVKLIGPFDLIQEGSLSGAEAIKINYFSAWNKLVQAEPNKYDVAGMIRHESINFNTKTITRLNESCSTTDMISENDPNYSLEDIRSFVKLMNFDVKEGIGVLMIADYLSKPAEEAKFHVVFLNMETREILICESFIGKPKGFGIRNYWAYSYYQVIESIKNSKYKAWKKAYAPGM
jgi:hypothetical protein